METNYHTHTPRCHHATGSEREYIEAALSCGMTTLGFSDHSPQIFPGDYYSNFRMRPEIVEDYVRVLTDLKKEYRGQIEILIGFEAEYYPAFFDHLLEFLKPYPIDYLLMGQHFLGNEIGGHRSTTPTDDPAILKQYVDQVSEGLRTGRFTYLAHPDVIHFIGDNAIYEAEMNRLIDCTEELGIPLELNFHGLHERRIRPGNNFFYPDDRFFHLAGKRGAPVILGVDAHNPDEITDPLTRRDAEAMVERCGLKLIDHPVIRPLW